MQFQVPQFIDVENKIVGPLTLKQFFYVASAFLFVFITYFFFAGLLWLITTTLIVPAALAFAFVKYHGRPLTIIVVAALGYLWRPRRYLWDKNPQKQTVIKGLLGRLGLQVDTFTQPMARMRNSSILRRILTPQEQFEVLRRITGDRDVARRVDYR